MTFTELSIFLSDSQGIALSKIKPDSRLAEDLGIDGDDADDFIKELEEKLGVDLSKHHLEQYFGSEGIPFCDFFKLFMNNKDKTLTVQKLLHIVNNSQGDEHALF